MALFLILWSALLQDEDAAVLAGVESGLTLTLPLSLPLTPILTYVPVPDLVLALAVTLLASHGTVR